MRRATILACVIAAHGEVSKARGQESEGIALALVRIEVGGASRRGAIASRLERNLSRAAVKWASRVGSAGRSEVGVKCRGIWASGSSKA